MIWARRIVESAGGRYLTIRPTREGVVSPCNIVGMDGDTILYSYAVGLPSVELDVKTFGDCFMVSEEGDYTLNRADVSSIATKGSDLTMVYTLQEILVELKKKLASLGEDVETALASTSAVSQQMGGIVTAQENIENNLATYGTIIYGITGEFLPNRVFELEAKDATQTQKIVQMDLIQKNHGGMLSELFVKTLEMEGALSTETGVPAPIINIQSTVQVLNYMGMIQVDIPELAIGQQYYDRRSVQVTGEGNAMKVQYEFRNAMTVEYRLNGTTNTGTFKRYDTVDGGWIEPVDGVKVCEAWFKRTV